MINGQSWRKRVRERYSFTTTRQNHRNAILERAKQGVFHFLSKMHIQRYVSEVVFRWNHRYPAREVSKNGIKKIIDKAKPILEQLQSLLAHATGTQLRSPPAGVAFIPRPAFR